MYLVFDVGGTFTKYALMNINGEFIEKGKKPTPSRPEHKKEDFLNLLVGIYNSMKSKETIKGISVSLPGAVDVENGIVYGGGALVYMNNVNLERELSELCDSLPIALENDAKCAALCEVWKGNASKCDDACLLVLGTGVGGAIVKDRKIHRGKHLSAGEFSHFITGMKREDLSSVRLIEGRSVPIEQCMDEVNYIASSKISVSSLCNNVAHYKKMPFLEVTGEKIYKWIDEGDEGVSEIVEETYFNIAKFCCNLQIIYDPEVVLIGGGISAEPRFVQGICRYAEQIKKLTIFLKPLNIQVCKYLNDANLIGALYNFCIKYKINL